MGDGWLVQQKLNTWELIFLQKIDKQSFEEQITSY